MKPRQGRSSWQATARRGASAMRRAGAPCALRAALVALALAGCAADRGEVKKHLMDDRFTADRGAGIADSYRVRCPDVLELRGPPCMVTGRFAVGPDGR